MVNAIEKGYNGNVNLKRKGVSVEFTQDMVGEFVKCAQNPTYFAEKYIQIVHVDRGLIPIALYDYQKDIVEKITNNRRVTVVTSRQAGKTTTAVAVILEGSVSSKIVPVIVVGFFEPVYHLRPLSG